MVSRKSAVILTAVLAIVILAAASYYLMNRPAPTLKVVIYGYLSEMTGADPSIEFSNSGLWMPLTYDLLLYYDPANSRFLPGLAESYEHSPDGLVWTFHLRRNARFHDGTPVTAQAVKFSIERVINSGQGAYFIWDPVERIEVVDDYTVRFYLKYPAPLDAIVASQYGAYIINPKVVEWAGAKNMTDPKITEWFNSGNESGSGAYRLVKWDPQHEVVFQKNPDWWGWTAKDFPLANPNAPDVFIVRIIKDPVAQENQLLSGSIHIAHDIPLEDVQKLKGDPRVRVIIQPSFQNLMLLFNTRKPPLNNTLVRLAIAHAIPYDDIVNVARSGFARVASGFVPYGMFGHVEGLTYSYNLTLARQLLAQAGYPDGIKTPLVLTYTAGDPFEQKAAELIKISLSKVGVTVDVKPMSWEEQWALAQKGYTDPSAAQDILMYYWWPSYVTPYDFLFNQFHSNASSTGFGLAYYSNPELDRLLDEAHKYEGIDRAKSLELYRQAQLIIYREAPGVPLYDQENVMVCLSSIENLETASNPAYTTTVFAQALGVKG